MIKIFKILLTSIILSYILVTSILIIEINKRNNVEFSTGEDINNLYYFQIDDYIEKKVKLIQSREKILRICEIVKEISINEHYYIGYLEGGEGKECNKYFYINKLNSKNVAFGLDKKDIKEKFGNEIKYDDPYSILYKYKSYIPVNDFNKLILIFKGIFLIFFIIIFIILFKITKIKRKYYINTKIIKFIKILIISLELSHIVYSSLLINTIIKREYVINLLMGLNNDYRIEMNIHKEKKIDLIKYETSEKDKIICNGITKIIRIEDYYIGYLEGENEEICGKYFYLNRYVNSDYKFGLMEKEIYNKFGEIKYKKPEEYLKKYGGNGHFQGELRYFSLGYGILAAGVFISFFIILNLLNYFNKNQNKSKNIEKIID